eukprot:1091597-Pyramimonas_sp.AAC.1
MGIRDTSSTRTTIALEVQNSAVLMEMGTARYALGRGLADEAEATLFPRRPWRLREQKNECHQ